MKKKQRPDKTIWAVVKVGLVPTRQGRRCSPTNVPQTLRSDRIRRDRYRKPLSLPYFPYLAVHAEAAPTAQDEILYNDIADGA